MRKPVRHAVVVGTSLALLTGAGVAYAAWTASGSGEVTAKAATAQVLSTVDVSASTGADLFPGATGDATIRIKNPNGYPIRVTTVTATGPVTAKPGSGIGTCAVTGVTFTNQTGRTLDVAANSEATFTFAGAVQMGNESENGCQGATFLIPVSLTGASSAS